MVRAGMVFLARQRVGLYAAVLAVPLALALHGASIQLPADLRLGDGNLRLLDRSGQTLAVVRDANGELAQPVRLDQLSPWLVPALIAAEDARFRSHPGIDPLAMLRALAQAVRAGRVVSGASTITQQLARTLFERPRSVAGKWRELAFALRLESELDKDAIVEAYLERVDFGPRLRGVEAASRHYFDKPAHALSLAEAAALVAVVRGPSRYDPERAPARLLERRNHVLGRMQELGFADRDSVERALAAPLALHAGHVQPGAFHFVRAAARGSLDTAGERRGVLRSTLDAGLQREVEMLVRGFAARLPERRASAAAVIVVDNGSAAVRAYVGSPDYRAVSELGQNDGALALRQPGSTLKPFVYALALSELGLHAASILPDLERRFASRDGDYIPQNYDRRFHGPVRLGQALAASLNVPAATLAERLGPERVVQALRRLGFRHLDSSGGAYGPGIALGVAEVQLVELAGAYRALAQGGQYSPLRYFETDAREAPERVLSAAVSRQIADILADPRERAASFGRGGPLELEPPMAIKTGTSKGNRDNWAVGFDEHVTVAVWVGNFDGSPMLRSSGASGAGPLFHAVAQAARRVLAPDASVAAREPEPPYEERVVCALSGELATAACPNALPLRFWTRALPSEPCSWHSGLERWPNRFAAWGYETGRLARTAASFVMTKPKAGHGTLELAPQIEFPKPRARFMLDPRVSREQQQIVLSARARPDELLSFEVDGRSVCEAALPFKCPWPLSAGRHELVVRGAEGASRRVEFSVE